MTRLLSLFIVLFLFVLIGTASCADEYGAWQKVIIPEVGSIRVPQEWIVTLHDEYWYFTDKPISEEGYITYLIGTKTLYIKEEGDEMYRAITADGVFDNIVQTERIRYCAHYSNSASYYFDRLLIDNTEVERYVVDLYMLGGDYRLIAWDDSIDEEIIVLIAKSFKRSER